MTKALIIVDIQNDFVEGGSLGVDGGTALAERLASKLDKVFPEMFDHIVYTQDWHIDPVGHFSDTPDFVDTWPVHCVAEEKGSEIVPVLAEAIQKSDKELINIRKGEYVPAYSAFEGKDESGRTLEEILKDLHTEKVVIVGIATEHCVRATAVDASDAGFHTVVWTDYCAGIDDTRVQEVLDVELPKYEVKVI